MTTTITIIDFNKNSTLNQWYILNDTVMGGKSNSSFNLNDEGHAVFSGYVTTENNGGFASVRYDGVIQEVNKYTHVLLKVRGDRSNYQLRFKKNRNDYYSYIITFETSGNWETIAIPMSEMYTSYRGRRLDLPNFSANEIQEMSILIGNKKKQDFQLEIDEIKMR